MPGPFANRHERKRLRPRPFTLAVELQVLPACIAFDFNALLYLASCPKWGLSVHQQGGRLQRWHASGTGVGRV